MAESALDKILETLGTLAQQDGMPTYGELREQLERAVRDGDFRAEAELRQKIGMWLFSIGKVARGREDALPIDATVVLELAADHLERSAACASRAGNGALERVSASLLGSALLHLGRRDEAEQAFESALAVEAESRNVAIEYESTQSLGDCALEAGNEAAALERYQRALELARELGDPAEEATQLGKVASALEKLGRFDDAIAHYEQSRDLYARIAEDADLRGRIVLHRHSIAAAGMQPLVEYAQQRSDGARETWAHRQTLAALPLRQATSFRHAEHYLRRLQSLGARFKEKAEGLEAARDFDREADQIRRGQAWVSKSTGELPTASQLVITYALTAVDLRNARTSSEERESWTQPALAAAEGLKDFVNQAELLVNSSWDCADRGQTREALDRINRAIELSEANGLSDEKGLALISRSNVHNIMGQYREALEDLQQGAPLAGGELEQNSRYLANLGLIYQNTGETAKAIEYGQRDLEAAQAVGDTLREARALGNLGLAYYDVGRYQEALEYHRKAGELARGRADKRGEGLNIANAGLVWIELRRFAEAEGCFRQALKLAQEIGDSGAEEGALGNLGIVFQNTGQHPQAVENFQAAIELARTRGHRGGEVSALHGLARVHLDLRNFDKVAEFGGEARRIAHEIGKRQPEAMALLTLGSAAIAENKWETAIGLLNEGLDLSRATGQKALEAGMHQNLILALEAMGRREDAVQHAREALAIYRQLGLQTDAQVTEFLIQRIQPDDAGPDVKTGGSNLMALLMEWIKIPAIDVADSKQFLLDHQDVLLTEEAENFLLQMIGRDPENKDYRRHHKLVRECRLKGIEETYGEYGRNVLARVVLDFDEWRRTAEANKTIAEVMEWVMIPEPEASKRFLWEHSEDLLSVNVVLLLGLFVEKHEDSERFKVFRELHKRCRKLGIEAGYEGFDTIYWHPARTGLLLTWFRSPIENFLVAHQDELLTDETEVVLELMFQQRPHWSLKLFRDLIRQARIAGIPKALVDFGNASLRYAPAAEQQE